MKPKNWKPYVVAALSAILAHPEGPALGQQPRPRPQDTIGATHGQIAGAIAGIAAGGALIGIGVYAAMKHNHSVTGCARSSPDGLTLTSDSDKHIYALTGEVAGIKPGERVRVSGKRGKEKSSGAPEFLVEKVSKTLGACQESGASH